MITNTEISGDAPTRPDSLAKTLYATVAQATHDIRSPVGVLAMMIEMMNENDLGQKTLMEHSLNRIRNCVDSLDSAVQAGAAELQNQAEVKFFSPEPMGSHEVTPLLRSILREKIEEHRDVHIIFDARAVNTRFDVQPGEFKRMISNVVNNAVEAVRTKQNFETSGGGVIVSAKTLNRNEELLIQIIDSGVGIENYDVDQVTRLGFTKGKEKGTGFGLYHARMMTEKWQGTLEIESKVGSGTVVSIRLPLKIDPNDPARRKLAKVLPLPVAAGPQKERPQLVSSHRNDEKPKNLGGVTIGQRPMLRAA